MQQLRRWKIAVRLCWSASIGLNNLPAPPRLVSDQLYQIFSIVINYAKFLKAFDSCDPITIFRALNFEIMCSTDSPCTKVTWQITFRQNLKL